MDQMTQMMKNFLRKPVIAGSFVCLLLGLVSSVWAADAWLEDEPEFLRVDEAFVLSTELAADGAILARWEMPDGYYLYRHRFDFTTRRSADDSSSPVQLGAAEIPPGKHKTDEFFGEVEVYYHQAQARIPVVDGSARVEVGISYQGCADLGLCYPPETKWIAMQVAAPGSGGDPAGTVMGAASIDATGIPQTEERALASRLADGGLLMALLLFFLGGVALAFTPCVLPMVPILSSIIVGESENLNRRKAFTLSLAYVLGMAVTYAVVGMLVGLFGANLNLQAALQSPGVLITFAAVFVALSMSMFGFYELQLPQSWQSGLHALGDKVGGGKHLSVVVMGSLSSLVVSPCVSAPLAGALIYISATGDAVLGGSALLALGLGMGVPLLIIGSSGGHLLPRAGSWMDTVKAVFGVSLLAVAIWLLERVVPASVTLGLWAALLIGCGVYLGALDFAPRAGWGQLWKASGAIGFVYGVLLLIGAASGASDPLRPLQGIGVAAGGYTGSTSAANGAERGEVVWHPVADLAELQRHLREAGSAGQPVILDLYADWCISCKVMERSVFPHPDVASQLSQFHLVRADITKNDADDKALLNEFGLFGPPSLVFFSVDGREITEVRVQGEVDVAVLASHLAAVLDRFGTKNFGEIAANFGETTVN